MAKRTTTIPEQTVSPSDVTTEDRLERAMSDLHQSGKLIETLRAEIHALQKRLEASVAEPESAAPTTISFSPSAQYGGIELKDGTRIILDHVASYKPNIGHGGGIIKFYSSCGHELGDCAVPEGIKNPAEWMKAALAELDETFGITCKTL